MKYENLKKLMFNYQRTGGRLMRFIEDSNKNIRVHVYCGAEIVSRPDGTWSLDVDANHLNGPALDLINILVDDPDFRIKKIKARTFKFGDNDFLSEQTSFEFDNKGEWTAKGIIKGEGLTEQTKELHKLTRRLRKKVQPQIRLLGASAFKIDGDKRYIYRNARKEVDILIDVLDGKNTIENLRLLMYVCNMSHLFGQGSWYQRNGSSEFQPKKIIDKILRRVQANKLAILEKYDERRKTTDRSKAGTRRAA